MKLTTKQIAQLVKEEIDKINTEAIDYKIQKKYKDRSKKMTYGGHEIKYYLIVPAEGAQISGEDVQRALDPANTYHNESNNVGHYVVKQNSKLEEAILKHDGLSNNAEDLKLYKTQRAAEVPRAVALVLIPTSAAYKALSSQILSTEDMLRRK
tara:strand:- start:10 stop:468 length:459 start_codon:yes stop_codon:yes gene_type:complete